MPPSPTELIPATISIHHDNQAEVIILRCMTYRAWLSITRVCGNSLTSEDEEILQDLAQAKYSQDPTTTAAFAEVTRHLREFHSFDIQWNRG